MNAATTSSTTAIPHEYIVVLVYTLLAITGLIGNCWVMMTVISQLIGCRSSGNRHRGTLSGVQYSACFYLLLLSIVDLISFVPVPLLAADIVANRWPFGIALCKLLYSCEGANKSLSPLVLTALSVDRYIAVCKPSLVWMRQTNFALTVIVVCVFISSLFILPVTLKASLTMMEDNNKEEHLKCSLSMSRTYDILHILICYVLPLSLICSVYVAILRRLYQHTRLSTVGRRTSISLSRVVKCSVLVVAFYFICWTPYIWMFRIPIILNDSDAQPKEEDVFGATSSGSSSSTTSSSPTSSAANPVLFLLADNLTSIYNSISMLTGGAVNRSSASFNTAHYNSPTTHSLKNTSSADLSVLSMLLTKSMRGSSNGNGREVFEEQPLMQDHPLPRGMEDAMEEAHTDPNMLLMYLWHALPYTQSAFNWLFYAFLNRNLRQSARCPLSTRSGQVTSTPVEGNGGQNTTMTGLGNGTNNSSSGTGAPLWRNIQHVGSILKSAGLETSHSVMRKSPFRSRSRIRSRSTTYLETSSSCHHNRNGTIISLGNPHSSPGNGLLSASNAGDSSHSATFFTSSSSLADMGGELNIATGGGSIRRAYSPHHLGNGGGATTGRPSWPNGLSSHNHYTGGGESRELLSPNGARDVLLINLPSPSTPSSFSSCGVIAENQREEEEEEEERASLDVPLIAATSLSPTINSIVVSAHQTGAITNLLGLVTSQPAATTSPTTVLVEEGTNQASSYKERGQCHSPDGSGKGSEGSEVEWL